MFPFRSVRLRLTLWYVLLLAVILAGFSAGVYLILRDRLYDNLDDSLTSRAATLLAVVRYEDGRPALAGAGSPDEESFVRLFDASGGVSYEDGDTARAAAVDAEAVERALRGQTSTHSVTVGDESMRVRLVPIGSGDGVRGALEVGRSEDDLTDTLQALLIILAVAYPVTLAVASAGGVFLAGRALSPIDSLTRLARRISAQDLSQRLDRALPDDEVGRLARTFNDMIARLDDSFRRQRQFTADASHELRTPLTAIKGQVEVALGRPRDAAAYQDVLRSVNEEVDRLIRMVGSLLTLARADAGQIAIRSDRVSLGELLAAAAEQVRPMAEARAVALRVAPGPPVNLHADEDLLLQLSLNLMDNAIKHTLSGGAVTAGWSAGDEWAELWVRDTGAGIAAGHLGRIFDRFYRVDSARTRDEGGAGLGLAICRWIAEAHGGSISAESVPGEGSTFTVRLPAAFT